jgi:glycosyltransferase involved in cell wall biosynthesis
MASVSVVVRDQSSIAKPFPSRSIPYVGFFLPSLGGGGAERVMVSIANRMAAAGWTIDLVLGNAIGPYLNEVAPSVTVINLGAKRVLFSVRKLAKYLRDKTPDALFATMTHANIAAIWARRLAGVKTRLIIREAVHPTASLKNESRLIRAVMLGLIRKHYLNADAIIAPSKGIAHDLARIADISVDRMHVIYNPIDLFDLRQQSTAPLNHPWFAADSPPIVLAVGRLSEQKDHAILVRAFALLRKTRPLRLMILGDGDKREALTRLANSLGLKDDVAIPGFVANPFPFMRRCAVFVLPSRFEGMPNSLIQALALGCPVVATDCPSGPREILNDGAFGELVPVGDIGALAAAISEALDHPKQALSAEPLSRFDATVIVNEYCKLATAIA